MNDGVTLSIRQFSEAWRLMCAGGPGSGLPIGFFNVALLTGRGVSGDALSTTIDMRRRRHYRLTFTPEDIWLTSR